jgi:hypothetical protein
MTTPLNGQLPKTFEEAAELLPTMGGRFAGQATPQQIEAARIIVYGKPICPRPAGGTEMSDYLKQTSGKYKWPTG